MKLIKKGYHRIGELCSIRNLSFVSVAVFVLSLLPICYLSFVNRATGDDYGYGTLTRAAWISLEYIRSGQATDYKQQMELHEGNFI